MKKYFGTDGIRGKVGDYITIELAQKVGKAMSILNINEIVVSTDTRISKDMLKKSLISGLLSVGINVIDASILSTPALAYYTYIHKIYGIMITASHNPYDDNGIKIFKDGMKISDEIEEMIEDAIDKNIKPNLKIGRYLLSNEPLDEYLKFLEQFIVKTDKKIILDLANGATYNIGEKIYKKITPNLYIIGKNPDGININENTGATHPEVIVNLCKTLNYDMGISFDGDGDRIVICDNNGNIYFGDQLIFMLAKKLMLDKVVLTKTSNIGIINGFNENNIQVFLCEVGDKNVYKTMDDLNIKLGGENSGHIIIKDILPTGDGLLTSLIILNLLIDSSKSLFDLNSITAYPEKNINIKTKNKEVVHNTSIKNFIEDFNLRNENNGKIILRASGTEDLIRLFISHKSEDILNQVLEEILEKINILIKED